MLPKKKNWSKKMTIEEKFFKTFGIGKREYETPSREYDDDGEICSYYVEEEYPEITDRVILELICILSNNNCCRADIIGWIEYEDLREIILRRIIVYKDEVKSQVQALFEEQNENSQD